MIHIVIAEDEDIIRSGLLYTIDWLSMNAVVVASAATGMEGLEKIKSLQPDIVITDIKMPGMSGLDMIEAAQKAKIDFIPIVLTSYSDFNYAKSAIALRVFDYLLKPVDEEKIKEVVLRAQEQLAKNLIAQKAERAESAGASSSPFLPPMVSDNPYIAACLSAIEQNYAEHPNIETLARTLKVSASYLSRSFKKHTSMTFLDFLNTYRIQKAVSLLADQKYRVYEVAAMTGFSSYKRFYEVFKSYAGFPPTELAKPDEKRKD
ncbi:response regulator [Treponema parvum]|uniref:Response regulator n=1 Tax=Treponema parvum TaxID=138851 RepID=A0A975F404_9SPIR|nr:response regulator [Treponema parvum]QTQ14300.1 response regulator [Treponema parvum]